MKYKKYYWIFHRSLWKSSVKEFFPDKGTVSKPANNKEFFPRTFLEIKFKVSYLASSEKRFFRILS